MAASDHRVERPAADALRERLAENYLDGGGTSITRQVPELVAEPQPYFADLVQRQAVSTEGREVTFLRLSDSVELMRNPANDDLRGDDGTSRV